MNGKVFKYACCAVLFFGMAGCANRVRLNTTAIPSSRKQPERLFVILNAPQAWSDDATAFTNTLSEKMQRCGTQTHVFFDAQKPETLSLNDNPETARKQILQEEASFSPDTIMSVHWISSQSVVNGGIVDIQFSLALVWRPPVAGMSWQGSANVPAKSLFFPGGGSGLASAIFDDLNHKGFLPQCPAPKN
ncbi:MAG: hypothetical protein KGI97_04575 [Alphaproteobacteria bacterium]|nr:hypothetical protein [Alphaproteobacteria bacterium]